MRCPVCQNPIDPLVDVVFCKADFDLAMERIAKLEMKLTRALALLVEFADTHPCVESTRGCIATWPDAPKGWCDGCRARNVLDAVTKEP